MTLLDRIERHLELSAVSPTRFGREFAHDPRFVLDLRAGRRPRQRLRSRLLAHLDLLESARAR
jgi:hypothetical protein